MARHTIRCASGSTYEVDVPSLSTREARERLRDLRERKAEQSRLEGRVKVIDEYYDLAVNVPKTRDLGQALERVDDLAAQSREATEQAAAYADSWMKIEYFCDGVEGYGSFDELPPGDAEELYEACRAIALGLKGRS